MSLEKILKKILDDAQAEADNIIVESRKKADEIKGSVLKEASGLAGALIKEAERRGQLDASRIVTLARLEKKIKILAFKKELVEKALEAAFQESVGSKNKLKRKIITKKGEREEPYDAERLKEELRTRLENEIIEALKI